VDDKKRRPQHESLYCLLEILPLGSMKHRYSFVRVLDLYQNNGSGDCLRLHRYHREQLEGTFDVRVEPIHHMGRRQAVDASFSIDLNVGDKRADAT